MGCSCGLSETLESSIEKPPVWSKIPIVVWDTAFHPDEAAVELYLLGLAGITCDVVFLCKPVIEA